MGKRCPAPNDRPDICPIAWWFCLLGADALAGLFEVFLAIIAGWLRKCAAFGKSVQEGRDVADCFTRPDVKVLAITGKPPVVACGRYFPPTPETVQPCGRGSRRPVPSIVEPTVSFASESPVRNRTHGRFKVTATEGEHTNPSGCRRPMHGRRPCRNHPSIDRPVFVARGPSLTAMPTRVDPTPARKWSASSASILSPIDRRAAATSAATCC
jgi:hypothetical protein